MKWNIPQVPTGRLFSVASPGSDAATELWFTIRIFDEGKFTSHLRFLKEGDAIELAGPFGKFIFDEADASDVGLIAGGSGISVLRSIYRTVLDKKLPRKVHLVFSVLNVNEIIYKDELAVLARTHDNFTYTIVPTDKHPDWHGSCGFVNRQIFDNEFKDYKECFYICGPQAFIDCSLSVLKEAGVPEDKIYIDHWTFYTPKQKGEA